jgi:thiol-disulfide isomerase/thioredoxin
MKRRTLISTVLGLPAWAQTAAGKLIPMDEAGFGKLVASQKGKVHLINFWATWCEPCRAEMPALAKIEAKLKAKGFVLTTVSADEPEDEAAARAFLKKAAINGSAYLKQVKNDDRFIASLEPKWSGALPALFLYDRTAKKAKSWIGESDLAQVEAAIAKLL